MSRQLADASASAETTLVPTLEAEKASFLKQPKAVWATALAALISHIDHRDTRVVVRLHSYEAFSKWPHLTNWSNIDDVVFVCEHLRDFARRAIPGLQGTQAPRLHVVPNAVDPGRFVAALGPGKQTEATSATASIS